MYLIKTNLKIKVYIFLPVCINIVTDLEKEKKSMISVCKDGL